MKLVSKVLIFTLLIGCNQSQNQYKPDVDKLLTSADVNNSINVLDIYLGKLCSYGDNMDELNKYQRNFYLIQNLEREVNNGGFSQYFYNSSGEHANETITSLKAINADKTAQLLQHAIDQFPSGNVPKNRMERTKVLKTIEAKATPVFNTLDRQFYNYDDDLNTLNIEYIRKYKDQF
jgi:hypothetical protein